MSAPSYKTGWELDRTNPSEQAGAVTPSDTAILAFAARGLYVGGAGDVRVTLLKDDAAVTFVAVPVGSVLPICPKQVHATGTTATNLVALF